MIKSIDEALSKWFGYQGPKEKSNILEAIDNAEKRLAKIAISYADPVVLSGTFERAKFLSSEAYISIPSSTYVEVASGIFDRIIENPTDIKFKEEEEFADKIAKMDFVNNFVLMVKFNQEGFFTSHYHLTEETIHCLKGSYIGDTSGTIFRKGDVQIIPPREVHVFKPISPGFALIELKIS